MRLHLYLAGMRLRFYVIAAPQKRWRGVKSGEEHESTLHHSTAYSSTTYTTKVKSEEFLEKFSRTQQVCKKSRMNAEEYSESLIYAMD